MSAESKKPVLTSDLAELQNLARAQDADSWTQLLARLTDLYVGLGDDRATAAAKLFGEIACRLLDDVPIGGRVDLSKRIAALQIVSKELVLRLAHDQHEVAEAVLEQSPVLADSDLVTLIGELMTDHKVSIGRRKSLGRTVTDTLIASSDIEVLEAVAENPGAKISERSYRHIAEKAKRVPSLQEKLVSRTDITQQIIVQLSPFLSEELKERVKKPENAGTEGLLDSLMEIESSLVDHRKKDRARARMLVNQINAGEENINDVLSEVASKNEFTVLCLVLSELTEVPEKNLTNAVLAADGREFELICKAVGMNETGFKSALMVRMSRLKMPGDGSKQVASFNALGPREAEKGVAELISALKPKSDESAA